MQKQSQPKFNLSAMAERIANDHGFELEVPPDADQQLQSITSGAFEDPEESEVRDMRNLLWSSIDNDESKDLDQIEYCETVDGGTRLLVGVADVDCLVPKDTPLDKHAYVNGTSVYTGVRTFPMIPEELSTDLSSLKGQADRTALIIDMVVSDDGTLKSYDVYLGSVTNKAKLAYNTVGAWLEQGARFPELDSVPGLEQQLRLQAKLSEALNQAHERAGALGVQTLEANAITTNGTVIDLKLTEHNKARDLIQVFMVTANNAMASFIEKKQAASIVRIVKKPEKWPRLVALAQTYGYNLPDEPDAPALAKFVSDRKQKDPMHFPDLSLSVVKLLGPGQYVLHVPGEPAPEHFSLAVHDYTHATAPNRRYCDLIIQRIIKALLANAGAPYTNDQLAELADHCMDREEQARKVERTMRKAAAAVLLGSHIGQTYDAIVTGVNNRGTFVRLLSPPAEGRIMEHEEGLDVGDKIKVRLLNTDPNQGFIDFAAVRL